MPLIETSDIENEKIFRVWLAVNATTGKLHPINLDDDGRILVA